ncbi:uncharacterized protein LOC126903027 [Daktulosphaira vitifoliae]|uniref:uncharacterized protein LOC126903027 n=1 Tax=Daktulosphaira vitifoliae TaxID=58002 RepID=UPI0021A9CCC6|nr:uncharacterized protein LOC126903027 [Daktulosphaira vitifoliae]
MESSDINTEKVLISPPGNLKNTTKSSVLNYTKKVEPKKKDTVLLVTNKNIANRCCIPGCISGTIREKQNMIDFKVPKASMFCPSKKVLGVWNSAFGLRLTENSVVCERHFKKEDVIYRKVFVPNSGITEVATLVSGAIPHVVGKSTSVKRSNRNSVNDPFTKKTKIQLIDQLKEIKCIDLTEDVDKETTEIVNSSVIINPLSKSSITCQHTQMPTEKKSLEQLNIDISSLDNNVSSHNLIDAEIYSSNMSTSIGLCCDNLLQQSKSPQKNLIQSMYQPLEQPKSLIKSSTRIGINETLHAVDDCNINSEFRDVSYLHGICKQIALPNDLWTGQYILPQNTTMFIQYDENNKTIKSIQFKDSLVPSIIINKKEYEYKNPIKNKIELENLLEQVDSIEVCLGNYGVFSKSCKGYFKDDPKHATTKCDKCHKSKDTSYFKIKARINENAREIRQLEERVSILEERVLRAKQNLLQKKSKNNLKNLLIALSPFGFLNAFGPIEL